MSKTKKLRGEKQAGKTKKIEELRKILESLDSDIEKKKRVLMLFAHYGTDEANEVITDFIYRLNEKDVHELRDWAKLALEEGEYLASVPRNAEEEEKMFKKSVHQIYMDRFFELSAKIEEAEEDVKQQEYEHEIVKRLKKKVKTQEDKEYWDIEEMAQHDILIWEQGRKERLEGDLKRVSAIAAEINSEIEAIS